MTQAWNLSLAGPHEACNIPDTQNIPTMQLYNAVAHGLKIHSYTSETAHNMQGREMRKYAQPPARARGTAGITADYLEAVEAESDYDDDGMTASNRARKSLLSRDRLDEQAEVTLLANFLGLCCADIAKHAAECI